jgi:hypothetical protein
MTALPRYSPAIERAVQADIRLHWTAIIAAVQNAIQKQPKDVRK